MSKDIVFFPHCQSVAWTRATSGFALRTSFFGSAGVLRALPVARDASFAARYTASMIP